MAGPGDPPRATVELPCGPDLQAARLPDGWALDLVVPLGPGDLPEPEQALGEVLRAPLHSPPLPELLPDEGRVLIMLPDGTRADGKQRVLTWLLAFLAEHGLSGDRVHLMIAPGTHRRLGAKEVEAVVGAQALADHPCFQHDCDGPVRQLGTTARGTPVALNARLWDYALLIPITGVVHHYFAGFGGGRKLLVPGAAARRTILANHRLVFDGDARAAGVGPGRLKGNPVAEDLAEAARMLDLPVFLVALIRGQKPDAFAGFWAGDLHRAHLAACRTYLGWKAHRFSKPYDLVLSASGGAPLDTNLIQAHKGIDGAFRLAAEGGTIVHVAECPEGLGAEGLEPWLAIDDLSVYREKLLADYKIYAQTVLACKEKAQAARIVLVSALPDETIRALGMTPAHSLQEAIDLIVPHLPRNHTTALFPDAAGLLPVRQTG